MASSGLGPPAAARYPHPMLPFSFTRALWVPAHFGGRVVIVPKLYGYARLISVTHPNTKLSSVLEPHPSGAYLLFSEKGTERFA